MIGEQYLKQKYLMVLLLENTKVFTDMSKQFSFSKKHLNIYVKINFLLLQQEYFNQWLF